MLLTQTKAIPASDEDARKNINGLDLQGHERNTHFKEVACTIYRTSTFSLELKNNKGNNDHNKDAFNR